MKLILDEMLPERLTDYFIADHHECVGTKSAGLQGLANGVLLTAAESLGFDVLVTVDKNIQYQINLTGRKIAVVIIRAYRNKLSSVLPHVPETLRSLESIKPGEVRYVGEPRLLKKS